MPYTPSVCGGFLTDKRSMVAFTWSITTVLTLFAFITAVILTIQVHTHYRRLERYYEGDDWYQDSNSQYYGNYNNNNHGEGGGEQQQQQHNSHDEEYYNQLKESYVLLSTMSARSITFVAVYTMLLSTGLSLYGSMAIVGFTSLRGVYIAPCFSSGYDKLQVGVFGGAIVIFANLLLVCAVILGEVKVADYGDGREDEQQQQNQEEKEPYQVERIATILAVACMFLSALYTIFAVLLFLCHAGEEGSSLLDGQTPTKMSMMMMENVGVGVGVGGVLQSESVGNGDHSNSSPLVGNVNGTSGLNGMGGNNHHDYLNMHHHHLPMHNHRQQQYHQMHHQMQQIHGHTMVTNSPGFITMDNSSQGTSE